MIAAQDKAAGVLPTPATASKSNHTCSVPTANKDGKTDSLDYINLQERFATHRRKLTRIHRAHDGRICYMVSQFGGAQYFTHLHDVHAHLAAIEATK